MTLRFAVALAAFGLAAAPASQAAAQPQRAFFWCWQFNAHDGRTTAFYSTIFPVSREVYHRAVEGSFASYVDARYAPRGSASRGCHGPYDNSQSALDERNDAISEGRDRQFDVVFTEWVYRG